MKEETNNRKYEGMINSFEIELLTEILLVW